MDDEGSPVRNADESAPTYPNNFSAYLASKARAEATVLAANKPGFRTIALARRRSGAPATSSAVP